MPNSMITSRNIAPCSSTLLTLIRAMSHSPVPSAMTAKTLRMSYRIARGETGVLTFEPYKSILLPLWRFRTPTVAKTSAEALYARFEAYDDDGDFVGMDMCRKFIQMGMTRAKRYANYKGGKKYMKNKDSEEEGKKTQMEKSVSHTGKEDKEEASLIFKGFWEKCRAHEGYQEKKREFQKEQKEWDRERKTTERSEGIKNTEVKTEPG